MTPSLYIRRHVLTACDGHQQVREDGKLGNHQTVTDTILCWLRVAQNLNYILKKNFMTLSQPGTLIHPSQHFRYIVNLTTAGTHQVSY